MGFKTHCLNQKIGIKQNDVYANQYTKEKLKIITIRRE
jgi:hypothetical protein